MARPEEILNWRMVDSRLSASGQPSQEQLTALAEAGAEAVINLAPQDNTGALQDEAEIAAQLGLAYTYIPVDFSAPTKADFAAFLAAMAKYAQQRTHVHCIYNARVSAFLLRHARETGGDIAAAETMMETIWRPGGAWARFLGDTSRAEAPHAYAGYDYGL